MTEKERHAAFYDESNWYPSVRFPQSDAFRVRAFEFYSLTIYELQMWTMITWDHEHMKACCRIGWEHKFYFTDGMAKDDRYFQTVGMTAIWNLMKDAEKKELTS